MNAFEIKNVSKSFKNFKLDNISFDLPKGCILGLIGENGAGKSTTIKLIIDALQSQSGEIIVEGKDNKQLDKNDVGIVSGIFGLPSCLKLNEIEKVLANIYTKWNHEQFDLLTKQLNIPTDTKYKDMSTGNKMKTSIVCAMSHNASLLILDEPTNGLDPIVRDEVVDLLFDFTRNENNSVLISSHIVSDLQKVCDYICFMHEGKILMYSGKDELLDTYGVVFSNVDEKINIDEKAIIKTRKSSYNVEYLVNKKLVSKDINVHSIDLEDLFIFLVKEKN